VMKLAGMMILNKTGPSEWNVSVHVLSTLIVGPKKL